jgi:hypothetical protein
VAPAVRGGAAPGAADGHRAGRFCRCGHAAAPHLDHNQLFAGLVGLLSGIGAALAYLQVTALGKAGEPEGRTVFYFSLSGTWWPGHRHAFAGFTPWSMVSWQAAAWLVPIGVLACWASGA